MSSDIAPRYRAALQALELRPGQRILEVGCGHGVAVTLICRQLDGHGDVHAVDRSPKMIEAATRRNRRYVTTGSASFEVSTVQEATFPDDSFDRILAIRVRDLWTDSDAVLPRLRRWLRPGGIVCAVVDDPGPGAAAKVATMMASCMIQHGFQNVRQQPWPEGTVTVITGQT